MRLFCRIFKDGHALCHGCCHHDVDGRAHRNHIQINMGTYQINRMCMNRSSLNLDSGSQCPKALQMLVDRSAADITASRKRYLGTLVLAEKRTDKIIGSTDAADVFVIYRYLMDGGSVDLYGMTIDTVNLRSNFLDCLQKHINITYIRKIFDDNLLICHNGSCQNTKRGILCSADHNISYQRIAAFHNILIHYTPL